MLDPSSSLLEQAYDQDDWDSDFDDDNGTTNHHQAPTSGGHAASTAGGMLSVPAKNSGQSGSTGDVSSIGRSDSKKQSVSSMTSFNRFSTFVKSGGESFVLGKLNAKVMEADVIQVVVRRNVKPLNKITVDLGCIFCRTMVAENTAG